MLLPTLRWMFSVSFFPRDTLRDAAAPSPKNSDTPQPITVMGKMTPVAALPR